MLSIRQNIVLLGLLIIAAAIGATIYLTLGQQEIRKRAQVATTPTPTPPSAWPVCPPSPTPAPIAPFNGTIAILTSNAVTVQSTTETKSFSIVNTQDFQVVVSGSLEGGDVVTAQATRADLRVGQRILLVADICTLEAVGILMIPQLSPTTIPNTCGANDCSPTCATNAICIQAPNVATRQCICQIPPAPTSIPTIISDTCGASDCQTCSTGATCKQVTGVATKQCSCQFPVIPTLIPTIISPFCSATDCQTCATGSSCRQVVGAASKQCTCQKDPPAFQLFLSINFEGSTGAYQPKRLTESIELDLHSQIATISAKGTVVYSPVSRHFEGNIILGDNVPTGDYEIFVKGASYLTQSFGTIRIQGPGVTFIPFSPNKPLLSCDLNNDDIVNMLDVGQIYTDIKKFSALNSLVSALNSLADIDRDGDVDIFDHNHCVANFLKEGDKLP